MLRFLEKIKRRRNEEKLRIKKTRTNAAKMTNILPLECVSANNKMFYITQNEINDFHFECWIECKQRNKSTCCTHSSPHPMKIIFFCQRKTIFLLCEQNSRRLCALFKGWIIFYEPKWHVNAWKCSKIIKENEKKKVFLSSERWNEWNSLCSLVIALNGIKRIKENVCPTKHRCVLRSQTKDLLSSRRKKFFFPWHRRSLDSFLLLFFLVDSWKRKDRMKWMMFILYF